MMKEKTARSKVRPKQLVRSLEVEGCVREGDMGTWLQSGMCLSRRIDSTDSYVYISDLICVDIRFNLCRYKI